MPSDDERHEHQWRPVSGWSGRYRCDVCKCLGHHLVVVSLNEGRVRVIRPYICSKPGCKSWAVSSYRNTRRCAQHKDKT